MCFARGRLRKRKPPSFFFGRIPTSSATLKFKVVARMRPLLMVAETSIVGGAMDGCKHLSDSFNRRPRKRLGRKCAWKAFRSCRFFPNASAPSNRPNGPERGRFMHRARWACALNAIYGLDCRSGIRAPTARVCGIIPSVMCVRRNPWSWGFRR